MSTLQIFINWLHIHYSAILGLFGGGAGLSILLEFVIHKFHINSKKIAYSLIQVLSMASAVVTFYITSLPHADILPMYASLTIFAQTVHRFFVSPVYMKYILPFLEFQSKTVVPVTVTGTATTQLPVQPPVAPNGSDTFLGA